MIWDVEHIRSILAAFNKRFPGLKADYWQETRSEIITRVLTEFQGNQPSVDVVLSEGAPLVLRAAGAMEAYKTIQQNSMNLDDSTLPVVSLQIQALAYNTKKIKGDQLPKGWEDIAKSQIQGDCCIGRSTTGRTFEFYVGGSERPVERRCEMDKVH